MATAGIALTGAGLVGLLVSYVIGRERLGWLFKPLASTGFLVTAVGFGALGTAYGQVIFAGLVLCFAGDVLLIPTESRRAFLAGLGAFLLGHVAFAGAFVILGVGWAFAGPAAAGVAIVFTGIGRWLFPHVPPRMKVPVLAYLVVIGAMVALAIGAFGAGALWLVPAAAVTFAVSDVAVARHRFVRPGIANKLWGLPLYYAAVLGLAATV